MLVTFECKAYSNITYFGDVAKQLLQLMGHSGTMPGAILADDVPKALARLQAALSQQPANKADTGNDGDNEKEKPIALATRALPLLELLNAAAKEQCDVMWH